MEKLAFKKTDSAFYTGKVGRFDRVAVPEWPFLMVDGQGDPNTSPGYGQAVSALYGLSYGLKFAAKAALGQDHTVGPLEGLWWADDLSDFQTGRRAGWRWTMMIRQPDWITAAMLDAAKAKLVAKQAKDRDPGTTEGMVSAVRLARFAEGECLQTLHVGAYTDEAPVISRLHAEELPRLGLRATGHHHEIYLSDPRRVAPASLRTILRQPVGPV